MEVINRILDVVLSTQFIATFTASAMAFLGVYLTLRRGQKTHESNLAAENEKRREQREFEAKKEAFANLSESITRCSNLLGQVPDIGHIEGGDLQKSVRDMSVNVNKVMLYADSETVEATLGCSAVLVKAYIALMEGRIPVNKIDQELKEMEDGIGMYSRWIESLEKDGKNQPQIDAIWKDIKGIEARKGDKSRERYALVESCRDEYLKLYPEISRASISVIICLRRELGFDADIDAVEQTLDKNQKEAVSMMAETLKRIREKVR